MANLMWAAQEGSLTDVEKALEGCDKDSPTLRNSHALIIAAKHNPRPEVVALLHEAGSSLEARGSDGWTALHFAASDNTEEVVEELIRRGADVMSTGLKGLTPLHVAAQNSKRVAVVGSLLANGARLEARCESDGTPLHYAVQHNPDSGVVAALLEHGAQVDVVDVNRDTPLHLAVRGSKPDTVSLLLCFGASVTAKGCNARTPLHVAALGAPVATVRTLLDRVPDPSVVNMADGFGRTMLHIAASCNVPEVVEAILASGADVSKVDDMQKTALSFALYNTKSSSAVVQLLLEAGADINASDRFRVSALGQAASLKSWESVTVLRNHSP